MFHNSAVASEDINQGQMQLMPRLLDHNAVNYMKVSTSKTRNLSKYKSDTNSIQVLIRGKAYE